MPTSGEKHRAENRPQQGRDHQRIGDLADDRQFGDVDRQPDQHRQEGDQRHDRIDEVDAQPSMIVEKRIVSSCTRCDAPSMWRRIGQWSM